MATFLDISVFSYFNIIFLFLLVFTVAFAFLNYIKMFGSETKQGWNAIIALAIAALSLMSQGAISFLSFVTPWFVVLFFVLFFIMFAVRMFGLGEGDMKGTIKEAWPWILTVSIIIILFGLGTSLGQSSLKYTMPSAEDAENTDTTTTTETTETGETVTTETGETTTTTTSATGTATTSFQQNLYATIFHPKVLGMFFLLLIATVTIAFMAQRSVAA